LGYIILRYSIRWIPIWTAVLLSAGGCSSSSTETLDKNAIIDRVDAALTEGDCATAVDEITPLYNSAQSDNEVRLKAASAYGCHATINFFKVTGELIAKGPAALAGAPMWRTMSELFPSVAGYDYVVEGGLYATDALQSALVPGAIILPAYQVNAGGYNVGSVFSTDRVTDANLYLVYASMASVGGILNRYGSPDPATFIKTIPLTWTTPGQLTASSDGCALASSVLNLLDSMDFAAQLIDGALSASFSSATSTLMGVFDHACSLGCQGGAWDDTTDPLLKAVDPVTGNAGWTATGCASISCSECPRELRNRASCTGLPDTATCAAAGIINYLNSGVLGWN
jgi:hypothetical protein